MAMSGTIYGSSYNHSSGISVFRSIHWTATKDMNARTITIFCYLRITSNGGSFYNTKDTCNFRINGKLYSISTPATGWYARSYDTPTVTSDPITVTSVDELVGIDISASFESSFHFYLPESIANYEFGLSPSASGTARVDPLFTSTEIVLTGANEITEQSKMDMVNNRTHSGATHSLSYTCGKVTETLFTENSGDYLTFTLPETLAEQNKSGLELSVTFTLTTHFPWGVSGSKTLTVIYSIPDKDIFKPHCTIDLSDGEHLNNVQLVQRYGGYVQGYSRFKIAVTPILSYSSEIASITIKANDETHVGYFEVETKILAHSGNNDVVVNLTDNRGRSNEFSVSANVLKYAKPYVSDLAIDRCDRVGEVDPAGEYIKVTFNAEITPLNNINSASYTLRYQTSAGLHQTDVNLTDYAGQYNVVNGTYIFLADSGNTYSVTLTATDDLDNGFLHEGADEATTIWNALASGDGFAFGTIASLAGVLHTMFKFYPQKGFMFPEYEESTLMTPNHIPNVYTVKSGKDIEKSPFDGEYTLIVLPGGGVGDFLLIAITCDLEIKINSYANSAWSGNWKTLTLT